MPAPSFVSTTQECLARLPHDAPNMAILGLPTDLSESGCVTMSMSTVAGVVLPARWHTDAQAAIGSPKPYVDAPWISTSQPDVPL